MGHTKLYRWVIGSLLAVVWLSSCTGLFASKGVEEEPHDDVRVAMKVKAELIKVPDLDVGRPNRPISITHFLDRLICYGKRAITENE